MKVRDVFPKDIHVVLEFSEKEIYEILDFIEKSMSLYAKVHLNGSIDESLRTIDNFRDQLKSVQKVIKEETEKCL